MRVRGAAVLATLVAAATLAACGGGEDETGGSTEGFDLTIGVMAPLSGDLDDFGPPDTKGTELALEQINQAVAELGLEQTVTLETTDTETDPTAAVQAARKLIAEDVPCTVGPWTSAETVVMGESVTPQDDLVVISPAATSNEVRELDDPDGLVNRTTPPDLFQAPTLAAYIDGELGGASGKVLNIAARNDSYGTGLGEDFTVAWEALGGEIGEAVYYDPEATSLDSEAQQIVSGEPAGIVIMDVPGPYAVLGPALVRTGEFDPAKAFAADALASPAAPQDAGVEATEGIRGTTVGSPEGSPATAAFFDAYAAFEPTDQEPDIYTTRAFDAAILCYLSAVAADSIDAVEMAAALRDVTAAPGEQFTWQELPEAIEALQNGDDIDYEGASGPIEMDEFGDATGGVYAIWRFQDGKFEIFDEVPVVREDQ